MGLAVGGMGPFRLGLRTKTGMIKIKDLYSSRKGEEKSCPAPTIGSEGKGDKWDLILQSLPSFTP